MTIYRIPARQISKDLIAEDAVISRGFTVHVHCAVCYLQFVFTMQFVIYSSCSLCSLLFTVRVHCAVCYLQFVFTVQFVIYSSCSLCSLLFLSALQPPVGRASTFTRFVDHTQRPTTVGRTPLDE